MTRKNIRNRCCGCLWSILVGTQAYSESIDVIKIRLPWLHQSQYAGVYVAAGKRLFSRKRGLPQVEIFAGWDPNIRPMDLVVQWLGTFQYYRIIAFSQGPIKKKRPVKIVAHLRSDTRPFVYFAPKRSQYQHPCRLQRGNEWGHKNHARAQSTGPYWESAGLTKEDIELVPVPPGMAMFLLDDPKKSLCRIWAGGMRRMNRFLPKSTGLK